MAWPWGPEVVTGTGKEQFQNGTSLSVEAFGTVPPPKLETVDSSWTPFPFFPLILVLLTSTQPSHLFLSIPAVSALVQASHLDGSRLSGFWSPVSFL